MRQAGLPTLAMSHKINLYEHRCQVRRPYAKAWLEKAMIEGMDIVLNGTDEVEVPVEVEARIARCWGEGG
jgi:hypothetical protein